MFFLLSPPPPPRSTLFPYTTLFRSSDENPAYAWALLEVYGAWMQPQRQGTRGRHPKPVRVPPQDLTYATVHKTRLHPRADRKSTRLNSSHRCISYAVFCLKKKKKKK